MSNSLHGNPARYFTTPITLENGQSTSLLVDETGALLVSGGGGGGSVESVNGKTGVVVLSGDDILVETGNSQTIHEALSEKVTKGSSGPIDDLPEEATQSDILNKVNDILEILRVSGIIRA
jgi:hypothetical protein